MRHTIALLARWVEEGSERQVFLRDVHGLMCARKDPRLQLAQEAGDLVLPDGMPLVWIMRWAGFSGVSRVCGIDLLPTICEHGVSRGWRHYFYGGNPGTAEALALRFRENYPGIEIVGTNTPPFRAPTADEDAVDCAAIRAARPHFLWVCLGTPKQDLWLRDHRGRCGDVIMLGVGGAFDITAGITARAPGWMRAVGLEWLYRIMQEPARLWRRYVTHLPLFVVLAGYELMTAGLARHWRG
jgi:N-acetylglucosaminyldiphosphoundecaprenol N-acetyl-beta-D-mannosaminyltransferase